MFQTTNQQLKSQFFTSSTPPSFSYFFHQKFTRVFPPVDWLKSPMFHRPTDQPRGPDAPGRARVAVHVRTRRGGRDDSDQVVLATWCRVAIWLWLTVRHGKSPFLLGKPSISMRIYTIYTMAMSNNQMVILIIHTIDIIMIINIICYDIIWMIIYNLL